MLNEENEQREIKIKMLLSLSESELLNEVKACVLANDLRHFILLQKLIRINRGTEIPSQNIEMEHRSIDLTQNRASLWDAICFAIECDPPPFPDALAEIDGRYYIQYRCAEYLMQQLPAEQIRELLQYASEQDAIAVIQLITARYEFALEDPRSTSANRLR